MSTHIKVDGTAFSAHAELLRKALAQTYIQKALEWVQQKKITKPERINGLALLFFKKAEEEFERKLYEDFPHPYFAPLISMYCIGSRKFFDSLEYQIKESLNMFLAQQKV